MLVHGRDPGFLCILRALEVNLPAVEIHLPLFRLVHAGNHLNKGRLTGTILSHQGVHLTGLQLKLHLIQRLYAGEDLGDAFQLKNIFFRHVPLSFPGHGDMYLVPFFFV